MIILYTTCASRKEAERIAQALLKDRLVACVNMWPVRSVYWWHDKVERASEWALLCKTRNALARKVAARIKALHSYKMPVIEQWKVNRTSPGVERWVGSVTKWG